MDPSQLVPSPGVIPVPWGWFEVLLLATFAVHLLLMNVMVGGGVIAWVSSLKRPEAPTPAERDLSGALTFVIAFAVNFGVAPFLFLQVLYGGFIYVSSQLMAVYWLLVIPMLIAAYYAAYVYKLRFTTLADGRSVVIGAAVVLLLMIGFLFTHNMTLMLRPEAWTGYFENRSGTILDFSDPTLIPRYLHFMTASLAVGGLFVAVVGSLRRRRGEPGGDETVREGLNWFTYATLFQIVIGFWFQMSLPRPILLLFMGGSTLHTGLFVAGLVLTALALMLSIRGSVGGTVGVTLGLVGVMVVIRDLVRSAYLSPYYSPSEITVTGEYSTLVVFILALTVCGAAVTYAVRLAVKAGTTARTGPPV